jgi:hypothetical protein
MTRSEHRRSAGHTHDRQAQVRVIEARECRVAPRLRAARRRVKAAASLAVVKGAQGTLACDACEAAVLQQGVVRVLGRPLRALCSVPSLGGHLRMQREVVAALVVGGCVAPSGVRPGSKGLQLGPVRLTVIRRPWPVPRTHESCCNHSQAKSNLLDGSSRL